MTDPRILFQWVNAVPPILNVGCESDPAMFGRVAHTWNVDIDLWMTVPRFICADGAALPFRDKSFTTVVLGDMLDHCFDPWAVLREAVRVAQARIVVTLPIEDDAHFDRDAHVAMLHGLGMKWSYADKHGDPELQYSHRVHPEWTEERARALFDTAGLPYSVKPTGSKNPPGWGIVVTVEP